MQTLGNSLEEARKRKGISIRDAAEATKIRGDYLTSFENNSTDIELPRVYVRGFLKNYAKFLNLDIDKLLADLDENEHTSEIRGLGQENREHFGHMDLSDQKVADHASTDRLRNPGMPSDPIDRAKYYKIALISGGVIIFAIIIVALFNVIFNSGADEALSDSESKTVQSAEAGDLTKSGTSAATTTGLLAEAEEIKLVALGDVFITVTQLADNTELFSGNLSSGEKKILMIKGKIRIRYTEGENLVIEKNGNRYKMSKPGVGNKTISKDSFN